MTAVWSASVPLCCLYPVFPVLVQPYIPNSRRKSEVPNEGTVRLLYYARPRIVTALLQSENAGKTCISPKEYRIPTRYIDLDGAYYNAPRGRERLPVYPCSTGVGPAEVTDWHTQVKIAKDYIRSLTLLIAISYG